MPADTERTSTKLINRNRTCSIKCLICAVINLLKLIYSFIKLIYFFIVFNNYIHKKWTREASSNEVRRREMNSSFKLILLFNTSCAFTLYRRATTTTWFLDSSQNTFLSAPSQKWLSTPNPNMDPANKKKKNLFHAQKKKVFVFCAFNWTDSTGVFFPSGKRTV